MKKAISIVGLVMLLILPAISFAGSLAPLKVEINSTDCKAIKDQIVAMMIEEGRRISKDSEYQLCFDKESNNPVFNIFYTNPNTLQKAIIRLQFDIAPKSDRTLLALTPFLVEHSFSGDEIISNTLDSLQRRDITYLKSILFKIKSAVDGTPYEELAKELEPATAKEDLVEKPKVIRSGIVSIDQDGCITKIEDESIAKLAGLQEGDVIIEVDLMPFNPNKANCLSEIDNKLNSSTSVAITFQRGGKKDIAILKKGGI